jgi:LuxR family maltose regulon positive regulatory protein
MSPSAASGIGQDVLATKLHVPRPRPGFVPRSRLLARLGDGMARKLVLVCTPAGFGRRPSWATGPEVICGRSPG